MSNARILTAFAKKGSIFATFDLAVSNKGETDIHVEHFRELYGQSRSVAAILLCFRNIFPTAGSDAR